MAKRRGPTPDLTIHRYVVKLTLHTKKPDHARVKKMLDDADKKGDLVIQALLGELEQFIEEEVEEEEGIDDGWGDAIM